MTIKRALMALSIALAIGISVNELAWAAQHPMVLIVQTPSEELPEYWESRTFTGGGGPLLMGFLLDLRELNASLQGIMDLSSPLSVGGRQVLWASGGFGFGGSTFRFGGFGAGGEWSFPVRREDTPFNQVRLSIGLGGLLAEQLVSETAFGGFVLGILAGGGGWTLQLLESVQGDFRDLIENPPRYVELERGFWFALPYLSFETLVFEFIGLKLIGGYGLTISLEDWKLPDGRPVPGGPLGMTLLPFVQFMLVFGG